MANNQAACQGHPDPPKFLRSKNFGGEESPGFAPKSFVSLRTTEKMRILIFSVAYLPLIGGAEVAVKEITQRLPDWQFDLITAKIKPSLARFEKIGQVNVYRIGFGLGILDKFLLPILGVLKAKKLDKEKKYSIIWSIMASQAGVAAVFFKFFSQGKKLLLTIQEGDPEEYLERYVFGLRFLYRLLIRPWHLLPFKKADYLTVISHDLKKRALKNGVKVPIKIVPNGVDLQKFKMQSAKSADKITSQKLKLGIREDEKVIITVSRLVKKNAVDDLIRARGQSFKDSPHRGLSLKDCPRALKLLVIGTGPDTRKLKKLAKDLKIENQVLFLGHINHNDLPGYLAIADVFARPSLSEGLGSAFLEAMAVGLPIIGTPVGGIPDFLKDRETGLFCQVKNPRSIALKIEELLSNDQLRERIIQNGQKLVQEKYSWETIALEMKEVFQNII